MTIFRAMTLITVAVVVAAMLFFAGLLLGVRIQQPTDKIDQQPTLTRRSPSPPPPSTDTEGKVDVPKTQATESSEALTEPAPDVRAETQDGGKALVKEEAQAARSPLPPTGPTVRVPPRIASPRPSGALGSTVRRPPSMGVIPPADEAVRDWTVDGRQNPAEASEAQTSLPPGLQFLQSQQESPAPENSDAGVAQAPDANLQKGYSIQIASLADRKNADRLVEQLTAAGHTPHTRIGRDKRGQQVHVVSVGPYQNLQTTHKLATELSQQYRTQAIVLDGVDGRPQPSRMQAAVPAIATHNVAPSPNTTRKGDFIVQIASFIDRGHADTLMARITADGHTPRIKMDQGKRGRQVWVVSVGPYQDRQTAQKLATELSRRYKTQAIVLVGNKGNRHSTMERAAVPNRVARQSSAADNIPATEGGTQTATEPVRLTNSPIKERRAYSIQTGVFSSEQEAEELMDRLAERGYMAHICQAEGEPRTYSIRIGSYGSRQRAQQAADRFARENNMPARVKPLETL